MLFTSSWGKLWLLVWNQGSQQELYERPHPAKNAHFSEWSMKTASRVPMPSLRWWGICMGCELEIRRLTIDLRPEATVFAGSWGSPCWLPNHLRLCLDWAQRWQNLTVAAWSQVIWGDESRFQMYRVDDCMRVRQLPGERFQHDCQAARVQARGGSVHVWGAFHTGAKSPLVLLDRNIPDMVNLDILRDTLVPFARQHFGDNICYQNDNATTRLSRVVIDYLQQEDISKMDQQSPDCNPIKHM